MAYVKDSSDVKKKTQTITIPGTGGVKVQTVAPKATTPTKTVSGVVGGLSAIQNQSTAKAPTKTTTPTKTVSGGVASTTAKKKTSTSTVSGVAGGLSAIEGQKASVVPSSYNPITGTYEKIATQPSPVPQKKITSAATTLGVAKTAQTNVTSPTAGGVPGGIGNIAGQKIEPGNQGQYSPVAGMAAANIQETQQAIDAVNAQYAPTTGMDVDAARQALQSIQDQDVANLEEQQSQQADALSRNTLRQGTGVLNAPIPSATEYQGLQYDPATGMALSGIPSAVGMFGSATGNPYFDQLMSMKFDYDPAKDPEYINGSKVLENQVAQMMVGRGGLYSSVNQAALSSKLIEFQIALRKQKYEQYIQDRSFMLQMANTVWDRQDAAFNQYMTVAKYNADREDAMFSRQMQQEQLNLQRASAALAQARYQAEIEAENQTANLNSRISSVVYKEENYNKLWTKWRELGSATNDIAAFFGVKPGAGFLQSSGTIMRVKDSITNEKTAIGQLAANYGNMAVTQAAIYGFIEQPVVATPEVSQTVYVRDPVTGELVESTTTKYGG